MKTFRDEKHNIIVMYGDNTNGRCEGCHYNDTIDCTCPAHDDIYHECQMSGRIFVLAPEPIKITVDEEMFNI